MLVVRFVVCIFM